MDDVTQASLREAAHKTCANLTSLEITLASVVTFCSQHSRKTA